MICDANIVLVVLAKQQTGEPINIEDLHKVRRVLKRFESSRTRISQHMQTAVIIRDNGCIYRVVDRKGEVG